MKWFSQTEPEIVVFIKDQRKNNQLCHRSTLDFRVNETKTNYDAFIWMVSTKFSFNSERGQLLKMLHSILRHVIGQINLLPSRMLRIVMSVKSIVFWSLTASGAQIRKQLL